MSWTRGTSITPVGAKARQRPRSAIPAGTAFAATRPQANRHIRRIQKTLKEANIKLDPVISDIMGLGGRQMIKAMVAGVKNLHQLAALADQRTKPSPKVFYDALHGRLTDHHCFMLELYPGQHDALSFAIAKIDVARQSRSHAILVITNHLSPILPPIAPATQSGDSNFARLGHACLGMTPAPAAASVLAREVVGSASRKKVVGRDERVRSKSNRLPSFTAITHPQYW